MNITVPDSKFAVLSGNAVKLLGYYQQQPKDKPITEGAKVTGLAIGLSGDAVVAARHELEGQGLISMERPTKTTVSINLLINY